MDDILPIMNTPNWGNLPTEIIKEILENLNTNEYLQHQLVNKQWHFASLSIVYKSITVYHDLTNDYANWEKMESLCSLLKNTLYDVGQHVKTLIFYPSASNFHILGLLLKHCPNVEVFHVFPTKELNDYITSAHKYNNDMVIWKKLRQVESLLCIQHGMLFDDYFCLVYMFRHSLVELSLPTTTTIGDEQSIIIYDYVKEFTCLKRLQLDQDILNCILDAEKLLQQCCSSLEELEIDLLCYQFINTQPLSQDQLEATYSYKPSKT